MGIFCSSDDGDNCNSIRLIRHVEKGGNSISDDKQAQCWSSKSSYIGWVFFLPLNKEQRPLNIFFRYFVTHVSEYSILVPVRKLADPTLIINNDGNKEPV